nr:hypothetical transcript [Hymenolepis microstoma]CDS35299.1 hypothetical transcript [Hymenolepis microstoma]
MASRIDEFDVDGTSYKYFMRSRGCMSHHTQVVVSQSVMLQIVHGRIDEAKRSFREVLLLDPRHVTVSWEWKLMIEASNNQAVRFPFICVMDRLGTNPSNVTIQDCQNSVKQTMSLHL